MINFIRGRQGHLKGQGQTHFGHFPLWCRLKGLRSGMNRANVDKSTNLGMGVDFGVHLDLRAGAKKKAPQVAAILDFKMAANCHP